MTAQAFVETETPQGYIAKLAAHFAAPIDEGPRRRATHISETFHASSPRVEVSEHGGTVDFGWGGCGMTVEAGVLVLTATAADRRGLRLVQRVVGKHLERFGKRERLRVSWSDDVDDLGAAR